MTTTLGDSAIDAATELMAHAFWYGAPEEHRHVWWVEQQTGHRRCAYCTAGCSCDTRPVKKLR